MNSIVRNIAIEHQASSGDFRGAMRQLTGGVSVVTAGRGRDISGMTVTSVSSLSVDPAALIVSINRGASSWPLLKRYGIFGVNILTSDQLDIAERFTGKGGLKGAERFAPRDFPALTLWATAGRRMQASNRAACRRTFRGSKA